MTEERSYDLNVELKFCQLIACNLIGHLQCIYLVKEHRPKNNGVRFCACILHCTFSQDWTNFRRFFIAIFRFFIHECTFFCFRNSKFIKLKWISWLKITNITSKCVRGLLKEGEPCLKSPTNYPFAGLISTARYGKKMVWQIISVFLFHMRGILYFKSNKSTIRHFFPPNTNLLYPGIYVEKRRVFSTVEMKQAGWTSEQIKNWAAQFQSGSTLEPWR